MTTNLLRKGAEALVDAYLAKCDKVRADGSGSEDIERDLIEPIVALVQSREAAALAEQRERLALICDAEYDRMARLGSGPGMESHKAIAAQLRRSSPPSADTAPADSVNVPKDPSEAMVDAGIEAFIACWPWVGKALDGQKVIPEAMEEAYKAMLAANPPSAATVPAAWLYETTLGDKFLSFERAELSAITGYSKEFTLVIAASKAEGK